VSVGPTDDLALDVSPGGVRRRLSRWALVSVCAAFGMLAFGGIAVAQEQPPPPPTTAPAGPDLPQPGEAAPLSGDKVGLGIAIVVLAGLVVLGRRERTRRRKKAEG
jgi:hypothetical protein